MEFTVLPEHPADRREDQRGLQEICQGTCEAATYVPLLAQVQVSDLQEYWVGAEWECIHHQCAEAPYQVP